MPTVTLPIDLRFVQTLDKPVSVPVAYGGRMQVYVAVLQPNGDAQVFAFDLDEDSIGLRLMPEPVR